MSRIDIRHHGAVSGVTGSCHQLFYEDEKSILIDCGLFQGKEASFFDDGDFTVEFPLCGIEGLFVTHCHIDHVGRIPWLIAAGFEGPIYASEATAQLLPLVLEDALRIGVTKDAALIDRILGLINQMIIAVPYGNWITPFSGSALQARFSIAGHILGSAYIEFDLEGERVVFSGDLGCRNTPLLPDPTPLERADLLILESTYGDRLHESREARQHRLESVLHKALHDDGTILIPAFSIGRTQELLYEIEDILHHTRSEKIKNLDVVLDSPLAARFTEQYQDLWRLWDQEAKGRSHDGRHPLAFGNLITVDEHRDHLRLVNYLAHSGKPAIVIAASGMCAGGRIVNYLKALLPRPETDVLFVGYQAEGTPGRDIQRYGPVSGYVLLDGKKVSINAGVYTLSGYSAHADQSQLVDFVLNSGDIPKQIRLVHGDKRAKLGLKAVLDNKLPIDNSIIIP